MNWIWNPKIKGSGIIECIPQEGTCPMCCEDCFFQSGRSYLEPLTENLPHIPSAELTENRIVRINDGNDSNNQRELVETTAKQFKNYFYNTSIPKDLDKFNAPVVLTLNPSKMTDRSFHKIEISKNIMFLRLRVNTWNLNMIDEAVEFYKKSEVAIIFTYMAYYKEQLPKEHANNYTWKKRTLNSYWVLTDEAREMIENRYKDFKRVYSCGYKGTYACKDCGNCLREYFSSIERIRA